MAEEGSFLLVRISVELEHAKRAWDIDEAMADGVAIKPAHALKYRAVKLDAHRARAGACLCVTERKLSTRPKAGQPLAVFKCERAHLFCIIGLRQSSNERSSRAGHRARESTTVNYWTGVRARLAKFASAFAYLAERGLITERMAEIDVRTRVQFEDMHHRPRWLERRRLDRLLDDYESALSTQLIKYGLLDDWLSEWKLEEPRSIVDSS